MGTQIFVAKTAGFCFGVKRAVEKSEELADQSSGSIYSLGELIHNPQEVERLRNKGIIPSDIDEIQDHVIIRTHGVTEKSIRQLQEKGVKITDLTCPYVKKIHNIVAEYCGKGYRIIIIGDENHPEVIGIKGWCEDNAAVVSSATECEGAIANAKRVCVVVQTTINRKLWDDVVAKIKELVHQPELFDTICNATNSRQTEAKELASNVDIMIVIGGRHSSNTKRLYEVCQTACENTYLIETAKDLPSDIDINNLKIGITAGASTPDHIIKEVIFVMENNVVKQNQEELSFAEAFEQSLKSLDTGETVKCVVTHVRANEIVVDLGYKSDGIIPLSELTEDPNAKPSDVVKVGDEIEAFIVRVNDVEGQVTLSKRRADLDKHMVVIEKAFETNEILMGKVIEIAPKGVFLLSNNVRIFIPGSMVSDRYVADLSTLLGQEFPFRIIEINQRRRRLTGSIKSVLKEVSTKKKDEFWESVQIGKAYKGVVKSITSFGAFVDLGGVDGLVHISELSWKRINHPSEAVKEGDVLDVYIKDLDSENGKISLGYKKTDDNPWAKFLENYKAGDTATGKVVRLVPFGAFVDIDGVDGLIHVSEISWKKIAHPREVLKEGDTVSVLIKDINEENQKVSLGYKKIEDNPWELFKTTHKVGDVVKCKIVRIVSFGAFAEIAEGVDGLVHISQISDNRINKVSDVLSIGQEVDAKITEIKEDSQKVSLSIRELIDNSMSEEFAKYSDMNAGDEAVGEVEEPFAVIVDGEEKE